MPKQLNTTDFISWKIYTMNIQHHGYIVRKRFRRAEKFSWESPCEALHPQNFKGRWDLANQDLGHSSQHCTDSAG